MSCDCREEEKDREMVNSREWQIYLSAAKVATAIINFQAVDVFY